MKLIEKIILVIYSIIMLILSLIFCLLIFRWADINLVQNSIMTIAVLPWQFVLFLY